jgi:hypothetical protein
VKNKVLAAFGVIGLLFLLWVIYLVWLDYNQAVSSPRTAPPMAGVCHDELREIYAGSNSVDNKRCVWRNAVWFCWVADYPNEWMCKWQNNLPAESVK